MKKRRSTLAADQLGFSFEPPMPARRAADLAGLDRQIAATVALALKDDARSREVIAAAVSELLGEPVSKMMLDAYASESRDTHNISAARLLALIAATERYDLLNSLMRRIGAQLLIGEEMNAALLGHLRARKRQIDQEIRDVEQKVKPLAWGNA